ncbi:MAG: sensor histidine kinase [Bacillota bacterium]
MLESIFEKHNVRNIILPLIIIILPLIIISIITVRRFENSIQQQTISNMQNSIEERLVVLKNSFEFAERECYEIAQNPLALELVRLSNSQPGEHYEADADSELEKQMHALSLGGYLEKIVEESSLYENIFFLDKNGKLVIDARKGIYGSIDFTKMDFYSAAERGNTYIQDVIESPYSSKPIILIGAPVFDIDNRIIGTAGTALEFERLASKVVRKNEALNYDYGIVNHNGLLIAHTRNELAFQIDLTKESESLSSVYEKMKSYIPDYAFYDFEGSRKVMAFTAFRTKNWHMFCALKVDDYMKPINSIKLIVYMILTACIIIAFMVILKTTQLKSSNMKLKETLTELQQTQSQLILSEKMAALGSLVAGVAHEINTPIGVGVTAVTHLRQKTASLLELYKNESMKRSDLDKYLETCMEASDMIFANLQRASNLIRSFKQIASDQSFDEKREFRLKEYIDEVILSLKPVLKKTRHSITVDCDENLIINSYPGSFAHIINNMVMNSIKHAYKEDDQGSISINVTSHGNTAVFEYSDDGVGMEPEVLRKVFDPFFTTKRGQGGTGLGMNIVYNIVTKELRGTIRCKSSPSTGTTYTIIFPLTEKAEQNE